MVAKWVSDAFGEHGIYDRHIILNNYPFLDSKSEYHYSTLACDVMRPRPEEPNSSLIVLTGEGMSLQEVEDIIKVNISAVFSNFVEILVEIKQIKTT